MIRDRIAAGHTWMERDGFLLCHIDEIEYEKLHLLLEGLQIPDVGTMIWDKRNPMTGGGGIATQHEYIICRSKSTNPLRLKKDNRQLILDKAKEMTGQNGILSEDLKREFASWVTSNENFTGGEKAYHFIDDEGRVYSSVSLRAPEPRTDPKFFEPLLHPVTDNLCPVPPNGFSRTPETLKAMVERDEILFGKDEKTQPRQKRYLQEGANRQLSSVIQDATRGKTSLDALGLNAFPYCHSVSFYETLLGVVLTDPYDMVLDYFAGSGTTGHAVINLNREDNGQRRFILVEMGDHFDTVLLPRIKKVTFAPEWKDGKPNHTATPEEAERSPCIVKIIRLDSYEDALNNIEIDDHAGQAAMRFGFDDYLLKYMLNWETKNSETLLNVEKLISPFRYQLNVHADGQTRARVADVPETFNYLLGLIVRTRRVYDDDGRRYLVYQGRDPRQPRSSCGDHLARDGLVGTRPDYERGQDSSWPRTVSSRGADVTYVNGDSFIPNAKALEPLFKSRMFAGVQS